MNVTYDKFNSNDVAKIIGVAPQTITYWVRKGYLKADNISDGTEKARYMFSDDEVTRVQGLIKRYGARGWLLHASDDVRTQKPQWTNVGVVMVPVAEQPKSMPVKADEPVKPQGFNADRVMNKILKLQDLKEELENLDAQRNQLMGEIEILRKEIMEVI